MLAPVFRIVDFEAVALHRIRAAADVIQLATREDVIHQGGEFRALHAELPLDLLHRPRDGVVQVDAAWTQQVADLAEISVIEVPVAYLEQGL